MDIDPQKIIVNPWFPGVLDQFFVAAVAIEA